MLFSFKHVRFIQKLCIQELNFIQKLLFIKQLCRNEQSRDRTIPADKNRRTADSKKNFLKNNFLIGLEGVIIGSF